MPIPSGRGIARLVSDTLLCSVERIYASKATRRPLTIPLKNCVVNACRWIMEKLQPRAEAMKVANMAQTPQGILSGLT